MMYYIALAYLMMHKSYAIVPCMQAKDEVMYLPHAHKVTLVERAEAMREGSNPGASLFTDFAR